MTFYMKLIILFFQDPNFKLIKEIHVASASSFIAPLNDDDVLCCDEKGSRVNLIDLRSTYSSTLYCDFKNVISQVSDLLVSNKSLFVLGFEFQKRLLDKNNIKVIKVDTLSNCQPLVIYKLSYNCNVCKLTRSYCQQNIVLILRNKLIILHQSGNVIKTVDTTFNITNALQLNDENYVICAENYLVYIINDSGEYIWKYSPTNDCHKMTSPCLAVDDYGNIFMGERNVMVFNHELDFKSLHVLCHTNERILKMCYDEVKDTLLVLVEVSNTRKLMLFKV